MYGSDALAGVVNLILNQPAAETGCPVMLPLNISGRTSGMFGGSAFYPAAGKVSNRVCPTE